MANKSVAVLDVRSSEITAVVAERGVNNTFIIKSKYTCRYDGYAEGEFLDEESFCLAVADVVHGISSYLGNKIKRLYVSVPGEFIKLVNVDNTISFNKAKKINVFDVEKLRKISRPDGVEGYSLVDEATSYFTLSDKRKVVEARGETSDSLRASLCYYYCKNTFINLLQKAVAECNVKKIKYYSAEQCQAIYLIGEEQRDTYAEFFDFGFISSTYSVVCANGVAYTESFSVGVGHLAVCLMGELDIPYDVAWEFVKKINLNAKEKLATIEEYRYGDQVYSYSTATLRNAIREGFDAIIETLEECRKNYVQTNLDNKLLYVSGESINTVRGASNHISARLVKGVEVVAPNVPYYDKPQYSSLFSLMNRALND